MRDIRFRAWDVTDQRMLYNLDTWHLTTGKIEIEGDKWDWYKKERILMQYTGLKDRNGKEIYEGDIVQEHHGGLAFEADFFQLKVVKWVAFGFMPFQRVIGGAAHDYANNLKEYIITGNIYENPELTEGGKP